MRLLAITKEEVMDFFRPQYIDSVSSALPEAEISAVAALELLPTSIPMRALRQESVDRAKR
jgi:hypothetical protein